MKNEDTFKLETEEVQKNAPPENHHLSKNSKGWWYFRYRVDCGRFQGSSMCQGLNTRCVIEAREKRDLLMKAIEKVEGIIVSAYDEGS